MDASAVHDYLKRLCTCADLAQACAVVAEAAGREVEALGSAVLLLDYTGTRLLPLGAWSEQGAPASAPGEEPLPMHTEDPLGFAMQTGKPCHAPLGVKNFACLDALPLPGQRGRYAGLLALPLTALGEHCIGGVLLGLRQSTAQPDREGDAALLCGVGALVLETHVRRKVERERLLSLNADITRLESGGPDRDDATAIFLGMGEAAQRVRQSISRAAQGDFPVLITGETGTGKELAAQALHAASPRHHAPFVRINCGALPQHLMESELFGYCKGAFSGADADHPGLLRSAHGGTVLLDEVGEMPLELQVKLLRVLQDHEVRPVGGVKSIAVNFRVVAATNRDLREALAAGRFRQDLYYRLAALHIHLPPLRQRHEDIPLLAEYFLEQVRVQARRPHLRLAPESLRMLYGAPFPGNVRQLRDMIRCAVFMADAGSTLLTPDMLHWREEDHGDSPPGGEAAEAGSLAEAVRRFEARLIETTLARYDGNVAEAARELALPRSTLASKLKKLHGAAAR